MEKDHNKQPEDNHDLPPADDAMKNKIDKHLRDIDDTISEEDLKNINTNIKPPATPPDEDIEPEKESPTSWEILEE